MKKLNLTETAFCMTGAMSPWVLTQEGLDLYTAITALLLCYALYSIALIINKAIIIRSPFFIAAFIMLLIIVGSVSAIIEERNVVTGMCFLVTALIHIRFLWGIAPEK